MNAAKAKKTFWGRIKSWFATTWIWNTIKNLFSSNDASKVNTAKQEGKAHSPSEGEVKGAVLGQEPENPATGTPELTPESMFSIKSIKDKLVFIVNNDILTKFFTNYQNVDHDGKTIHREFRAGFLGSQGEELYITCTDKERVGFDNETHLPINSVGTNDGKTVFGSDNLKGMKTLLGLNDTTKVIKITDISDKLFPKVASPSNGEAQLTYPKPVEVAIVKKR